MITRLLAIAIVTLLMGHAPAFASGQASGKAEASMSIEMQEKKEKKEKKPRRERSAAQKKNDQIMRDCGAEWRGKKDELGKKGTTWRAYLKECRAKKKA